MERMKHQDGNFQCGTKEATNTKKLQVWHRFTGSHLTYLNSFTGVLQLADHTLDSIIASHKDGNAITEL